MKKKKWLIWLMVMIVIFILAGVGYQRLSTAYEKNTDMDKESEESANITAEKKADDFTVYDENGNKVRLSEYAGKPRIVNFWASWCPPCKREMSAFQDAIDSYGEKIDFLMINETDGERETMETAQTFLNDNGYHMKMLYDTDGNAGNTYHVLFLPRTLFIDVNGMIAEDHVGELSEEELTDKIGKLLEVKETD